METHAVILTGQTYDFKVHGVYYGFEYELKSNWMFGFNEKYSSIQVTIKHNLPTRWTRSAKITSLFNIAIPASKLGLMKILYSLIFQDIVELHVK